MRRIERRTPCIGDNQPHGRGRHAECGAQHVTQRDTRRSAALRILDAQEAQRGACSASLSTANAGDASGTRQSKSIRTTCTPARRAAAGKSSACAR